MGPQKSPSHYVSYETYVDAIAERIDADRRNKLTLILLEDKDRRILALTRIIANQSRAFQVKNRKGAPGYRSWLWKFRRKNNPRLAARTAARAVA